MERPPIKSGDLIAFSHGGWSTWKQIKVSLVRMFTRSTYSHVAVAWVVGAEVNLFEAVKPKTRISKLADQGDYFHIPVDVMWTRPAEAAALSKVGIEYSEIVAVEAFFEPLDPDDCHECAAYALYIYRHLGVNLGRRATPDAVVDASQSAGDGATFFVKNGGPK